MTDEALDIEITESPDKVAVENFADLAEKLKASAEGFFEISVEDYHKASKVFDNILKLVCKFDADQIEVELAETNVDIREVCEANYTNMLKEVAAHRDYLIEQEGKVEAYVSWYNKGISLLSAYVKLLSKTKPVDLRTEEALIKVNYYHVKKEFYVDLLTRLKHKREAYSKKYDSVSRLVSYWDTMAKVNFVRSSTKIDDKPY